MHSVERIFSLMNAKWTAQRSDKDRWAPNLCQFWNDVQRILQLCAVGQQTIKRCS